MLVKCPKCNFTQPKDRYCANCGVDMDNFSRQPDPIGKRIVNNATIYILIAAALLLGTLWFVRKHQQEELASRVQFLKGGPVIADRQQPPPPSNLPAPLPPAPQTVATAENAAPAATEPAKPAEAADSIKVHILYAEVDHDTMEMLRTESLATQQHTDFGDFKAGALPAKLQQPSRERGVRVLEKIEKTFDSKNQSQQWFNGIKGPDGQEHLGITTLLSLDHNGQGNLRGEVEIMRLFNEANDADTGPVRRNYPSTSFELTPGMSWMITVRLPTIAQEEPGQSSDGVMRIFNSPQYKSRQTEFTIFFEFDTPGASPNPAKN